MYSEDAVELLMLTAATESLMGKYIRQVGGGPALGIFQMEPATEKDIWDNYLVYRVELADKVEQYQVCEAGELEWNLAYQIIMARIHYLRVPHPLPSTVEGMATYYKKHFNTELGKGSVAEAVQNYNRYVL